MHDGQDGIKIATLIISSQFVMRERCTRECEWVCHGENKSWAEESIKRPPHQTRKRTPRLRAALITREKGRASTRQHVVDRDGSRLLDGVRCTALFPRLH